MGRSNASFAADDEASSTLRDLGYSDEEIGRTAGSLPSEMASEDRLRLSLRALSANHTEQVQRKAEAAAPPPNPKMFNKQEGPADSTDEAYRRGRRDERFLKRNDPNYKPPPRKPRPPSAASQRAALMGSAKKWSSLAKKARGKRR